MLLSRHLSLEFVEELRPGTPDGRLVTCSVAGPVPYGAKDPAGYYFHLKALQQAGLWEDPTPTEDADADANGTADAAASAAAAAGADSDKPPPGVDWKGSKARKRKAVKKKDGSDPYSLLGLANERWTASEAQIRAAYRKTCLENHPDKALINVTDEAERERIVEHFKTIQDAYDILSDPAKRREFDSTDEFDDTLPLQCDPKDFLKVFGPAFRRNARWSTVEPVPDVGDDSTPWGDVSKFYDFWYTFKSWREFPHPDEEDVEAAESREHRRWIERNNAKLREKGKKEEGRRLREFVDAAYKHDPRVLRKKEEDRLERERKKAEKEEARRRAQEEEEARKAAEEEARRVAEEEAKRVAEEARKQREAVKAQLKQLRKRLRTVAEGSGGARLVSEDDVEKLITKLEPEALAVLVEALSSCDISEGETAAAAQKGLLTEALRGIDQREEEAARTREAAKREAELAAKVAAREEHRRKMAAMREWSEEELRLLDKACNKFPMGTPKRWEAVAAFVRTRTLDEVLLMVKDRQGASATRMKAQEDWKGAQKKPAEVRAQADTRAEAFTDVEVKLTGEAAIKLMQPAAKSASGATAATATAAASAAPAAKAAASGGSSTGTPAAPASPSSSSARSKAAKTPAATATAAGAPSEGTTEAAAGATTASSAAAAKGVKKAAVADSGAWSEAQELALVAALKQCPKELGAERWDAVAVLVPGKTKAQCFKRFKELREAFRSKKQAAGEGGGGGGDDGDD
uniref:GlsA n=1 Tax=Volvox carteri f. nagariensis TaxID=3068 RepID=Q9S729_VOLCA|nr:GlsA [Volvox carteri f. nagariensis]AAD26633.1 GlsA [Volvox carteri f. nagariensis]